MNSKYKVWFTTPKEPDKDMGFHTNIGMSAAAFEKAVIPIRMSPVLYRNVKVVEGDDLDDPEKFVWQMSLEGLSPQEITSELMKQIANYESGE